MMSPKELEVEEKKRVEAEEREKRQKNTACVHQDLEGIMFGAIGVGNVTSKGGVITYSGFRNEYLSLVTAYFLGHGWKAIYEPSEESDFSMTTKSEYSYTKHVFRIEPVEDKK